jgi:type II secretory pathway pseudopilin PulG
MGSPASALPLWTAAGAAELLLVARREYDELSGMSSFGGVGMKIVHFGLLMLLAVPLACASAAPAQAAQSQDDLAAAARRAREQRKSQHKAAKVWDNDNIPTAGGVNVVGPPEPVAPAKTPEKSAKQSTSQKSAEAAKKKNSDLEADLKAAKDNLKSLETDLDFAQRKYALDQQSFYQNPNYSSNTSGAAALKDEENQIDAKKQAVQAAKDKVTDLEAKLGSSADSGSKSNDNSEK